MTEAHSKSRQQAEIAFSNEQTQFFAKKTRWKSWIVLRRRGTPRPSGCERRALPRSWPTA